MFAHRRSDRGSILLIAVVLVVVVMGMAGAYLVVAGAQSDRVVRDEERGRARLAAEAGIDHVRVALLALVDPQAVDPTAAWDAVLDSDSSTPSWADGVPTPDGSYTVRVSDNDDGDGLFTADSDNTVLLEAVGYGPRQGEDGEGHVIRCIVTLEVHDPTSNFAILTGGDLDISGSQVTDGTLGSVHTNEDLTLQGDAEISQTATASATATQIGATVSVGGQFQADRPLRPIAPVDPAAYRPDANWILTADGRVIEGATGMQLFDFDAVARGVSASYNGFTWTARTGWRTESSGWVDGMYYIEGDFFFTQGGTATDPWAVTLVAEGSIGMDGNPYLRPYYNDTELLVAGEDIYAHGTGTGALMEGLVLAHEQIRFDGNITFTGRIVAESAKNTADSLNPHALNPLLSQFGGSVHITYDGGLTRSLVTDFRLPVRSWQEDLVTNAGR
ncbi:MAG: hypothetical protein AAB434_09195 [Planctomycetota bacterium]